MSESELRTEWAVLVEEPEGMSPWSYRPAYESPDYPRTVRLAGLGARHESEQDARDHLTWLIGGGRAEMKAAAEAEDLRASNAATLAWKNEQLLRYCVASREVTPWHRHGEWEPN